MATDVTRALRRLAHPRSRRSQLWACVYCGVFDVDVTETPDEATATPRAD